jgi:hypothetical protein
MSSAIPTLDATAGTNITIIVDQVFNIFCDFVVKKALMFITIYDKEYSEAELSSFLGKHRDVIAVFLTSKDKYLLFMEIFSPPPASANTLFMSLFPRTSGFENLMCILMIKKISPTAFSAQELVSSLTFVVNPLAQTGEDSKKNEMLSTVLPLLNTSDRSLVQAMFNLGTQSFSTLEEISILYDFAEVPEDVIDMYNHGKKARKTEATSSNTEETTSIISTNCFIAKALDSSKFKSCYCEGTSSTFIKKLIRFKFSEIKTFIISDVCKGDASLFEGLLVSHIKILNLLRKTLYWRKMVSESSTFQLDEYVEVQPLLQKLLILIISDFASKALQFLVV